MYVCLVTVTVTQKPTQNEDHAEQNLLTSL